MDAIEAAAMAAAEKAFSDAFHDMNVGDGQPLKAAIAAYLEATGLEKNAKHEYGWLIEDSRNHPSGIRYRTWGDFGPEWTSDPNKALRFARRQDAEMFARDDEDAWHIVEHMWPAVDSARGGEHG